MTSKPVISLRLTEQQIAYLRAEAERLGISMGELVRRIIDEAREAR